MDPTMLAAIAANQVAGYLDELEQERRRTRDPRRRTRRRLAGRLLRTGRLRLRRRRSPTPIDQPVTATDGC